MPYCDTLYKDEKQCFENCMTASGYSENIDQANYKEPGACPPTVRNCVSLFNLLVILWHFVLDVEKFFEG